MLKRSVLKIFGVQILALSLLGSCVISRRVVVGISPDIQSRYDIYPSIELDVAAVTGDEAEQIKTTGVDGYFSPDNPLRKRLEPFTVYFDEESTETRELHIRDSYWREWQKKKPSRLVVIADLPHSTNMPKDDPRIIFINIKKTFFTPPQIFIEVDPEKIVRVYKRPKDPRVESVPAAK